MLGLRAEVVCGQLRGTCALQVLALRAPEAGWPWLITTRTFPEVIASLTKCAAKPDRNRRVLSWDSVRKLLTSWPGGLLPCRGFATCVPHKS